MSPTKGEHYVANIEIGKNSALQLTQTIELNTMNISLDQKLDQQVTDATGSSSLERLRQNKALLSDNKYVQRVLNLNPNPQSLLMKRISNNMYKNKMSSNARHLGYNPLASQRGPRTDGASALPQNTQSSSQNRTT